MKLNIENLQQIGAFVGQPIKKTITWAQVDPDGTAKEFTADTYIRRGSCATLESEARMSGDGKKMFAVRIASSVCDENGEPILTYEQALDLNDGLSAALFAAVIEVNPRVAKTSRPPMKSGANSSSTASAAEPSSKPKRAYRRKK
jgi:hypothetical protein